MSPKKRYGLGRGLDALIPGGDESPRAQGGVHYVPLDAIRPNPHQPRATMNPQDLEDLAASIREHGVLQPLIVTRGAIEGEYVLVAGERRWRAARQAGLERVPVLVREVTAQEQLELALIENIQRADLNPLEEAEAYRQLHEMFGLTHEEIARRVGKSRVAITNALRLLRAAPAIRQALMEGRIREGHARALLGLADPAKQEAALHTVLAQGLSVRQTEALVRRLQGRKVPSPKPAAETPPEIRRLEARLEAHLGTRVKVQAGSQGGRITLYYYSDEELESLLQRLLRA